MKPGAWRYCLLIAALTLVPASRRAGAEQSDPDPAQGTTTGVVRIYTDPPGAQVWVDGVPTRDVTPVEITVSPGGHDLRLTLDQYQERTREVEVEEGKKISWRVRLKPEAEYASAERVRGFQGGYVSVGGVFMRLVASNIEVGLDSDYNVQLRDKVSSAEGIAIQLRYVHPLEQWGFLIVDAAYQDARIRLSNLYFPDASGGTKDDYNLLLARGQFDLSVGANAVDYLVPYVGGGLNYSVLYDSDKSGILGADSQEAFMGYTVKTGVIVNTRVGLVFSVEYQYHWAYALEDYMLIGTVGYQF
jgi:opacity protein-like surface antigen